MIDVRLIGTGGFGRRLGAAVGLVPGKRRVAPCNDRSIAIGGSIALPLAAVPA